MLSFFFQVRTEGNSYCVTGYKVLSCTYPDRTTKHNNDFLFVLIMVCYSATGFTEACEKHIQT